MFVNKSNNGRCYNNKGSYVAFNLYNLLLAKIITWFLRNRYYPTSNKLWHMLTFRVTAVVFANVVRIYDENRQV